LIHFYKRQTIKSETWRSLLSQGSSTFM